MPRSNESGPRPVDRRHDRGMGARRGTVTAATRTRRAQKELQNSIKEWILEHGLETGDPIPTELELVDELGVGRNSVREALKALQAVRIVEIRHGFGTYVGDCGLEPFTEALVFRARKSLAGNWHDLHELIDLRQGLETGMIRRVMDTINDDQLDRLAQAMDRLRGCVNEGRETDAADCGFHEELFSCLDNQLLIQLLDVFWDAYYKIAANLLPAAQDLDDVIVVHQAIYDAVAAKDENLTVAAIRQHFEGIRRRIHAAQRTEPRSHPGDTYAENAHILALRT